MSQHYSLPSQPQIPSFQGSSPYFQPHEGRVHHSLSSSQDHRNRDSFDGSPFPPGRGITQQPSPSSPPRPSRYRPNSHSPREETSSQTPAEFTSERHADEPDGDASRLVRWCAIVANRFVLSPEQLADLHSIVQVWFAHYLDADFAYSVPYLQLGSSLDNGDLQLRIFQQATLFKLLNAVEQQKVDYDGFWHILNELQQQASTTFSLSKMQLVRDFFLLCSLGGA